MLSENFSLVSAQWRPDVTAGILQLMKTHGIYFSRSRRPPKFHLILNGRNIPFVNSVKYLGLIFDKKVSWRLHIEMIEINAIRTLIRIYSIFKSERLSADINLTLHKALIRSITYACPTWEFATDNGLLKLQRLQNKVLRTIGTVVRDLHMALKLLYIFIYIYDYTTKLCRQAEGIQHHYNAIVRNTGQRRTPTQEIYEAYTWRRSSIRPFK
jgi:hypothetical protein